MSSAVAQPAARPVQPSAPLGSHSSPVPSTSPRQYQHSSQQAQPQRDQYHSPQTPNAADTPASSRRPSRRPSGNSAASPAVPHSNFSPATSSPATVSPRMLPLPPSAQASPYISANPAADSPDLAGSPIDTGSGPPIPPPPRTSSHQRTQTGPSPGERVTSSRHVGRTPDDRPSSSRGATSGDGRERGDRERAQARSGGSGDERTRTKDDSATAAAAAARSRRRAQPPHLDDVPQRSSSTREARARQPAQTVASRSSAAVSAPSPGAPGAIPREGSQVINRVVVTDPQVDLARERERMAEAQPSAHGTDITPVTGLGLVGSDGVEDGGRGGSRSRQDHSSNTSRRKETRFGDYILGQTLGEGEFGKVKMGWKKDAEVQVAIKLIRRESLGSNPSRLPKIYREISILRELSHPNIVRLHEMVETDRHIGIILEYASGGELFDFILNHRYLKDDAARRLFAQLVSGVGYLHKKGIVHRDLKLENLLLDRNRNIIITDFGFANTFNPRDELGDEIEYNLGNKDFVRSHDLERVREKGHRRGDLMQTSCGSPCYAAPELVVSESLYTGRKVDVWSCGVILYAMLAGYLPFDDDPANPEGDNINLLYKYIVNTVLTFPEYVTPHARDLLRRILVPDPRKRADLFEVARHSWLSQYSHVVSFITSSTTTTGDIANTTVTADNHRDAPLLARSASVREPTKPHAPPAVVGGLTPKHGNIDSESPTTQPKSQRDAKRRTVQVEYVAPQSQTVRGDMSPTSQDQDQDQPQDGREVSKPQPLTPGGRAASTSKPLPEDPPRGTAKQPPTYQTSTQQRSSQAMGPPTRPGRDVPRAVSDNVGAFAPAHGAPVSTARPTTGGSMNSAASMSSNMRLPSRGSYSRPPQPVAPTVAATNAQGRLAQPKSQSGRQYVISNPILQADNASLLESSFGQPSVAAPPPRGPPQGVQTTATGPPRGHKRSNTIGNIGEKLFGRPASFFGKSSSSTANQQQQQQAQQAPQKNYPPTSMRAPVISNTPRQSMESRRSGSFAFGRKNSSAGGEKTRRFSFLPAFNLRSSSSNSSHYDDGPPQTAQSTTTQRDFAQNSRQQQQQYTQQGYDGSSDPAGQGDYPPRLDDIPLPSSQQQQYTSQRYPNGDRVPRSQQQQQQRTAYPGDSALTTESESSLATPQQSTQRRYPPGFNPEEDVYDDRDAPELSQTDSRQQRTGVLQRPNRKFADAYEAESDGRYPSAGGHSSGSSGAARKVMDFFRRRGKARGGDERS
ncbi:MAG: hypothetical protein M4579_002432 [Chaenotheca gracillima]|nr:MAG: hypothetical protein M4579_002432 [Chaenotheca gracillima]